MLPEAATVASSSEPVVTVSSVAPSLPSRARASMAALPERPLAFGMPLSRYLMLLGMSRSGCA